MRRLASHLTDEDVLRAIDRELSPRRQAAADAHLAACAECRARYRLMTDVSVAVSHTYQRNLGPSQISHSRQTLKAALAAATSAGSYTWTVTVDSLLSMTPAWSLFAVVATTALLALELYAHARSAPHPTIAAAEYGALPIASLTPGATLPIATVELCTDEGRERQRRLPASVRQTVLRRYGVEHVSPAEYELDYLITPELGGAGEAANLWPERYGVPTWNARVKDQLEELLPRLVCSGTVPLQEAQRDIAVDWIAAYKKYFKTSVPLPVGNQAAAADEKLVFEETGAPVLALAAFSTGSGRLRPAGD
jgi:hypothetical protein